MEMLFACSFILNVTCLVAIYFLCRSTNAIRAEIFVLNEYIYELMKVVSEASEIFEDDCSSRYMQ